MTSNTKSRAHTMKQDASRHQYVAVPVIPVKLPPEMTHAIRRRDGVHGVQYWSRMVPNGMIVRPARGMTIEQAFPKRFGNGYNFYKAVDHTDSSSRDTSGKSTKLRADNDAGKENSLKEPKKSTMADFGMMRESRPEVPADRFPNYQAYDAKVRYIDNSTQKVNIAASHDKNQKSSKKKESKKEDISKQNGHSSGKSSHTVTKGDNNKVSGAYDKRMSLDYQQGYRVITPNEREKLELEQYYRHSWSEMAHLSANNSIARFPEPTFKKIGMNHTFRIPRPKARTISLSGSIAQRNLDLTSQRKRAVRFGQDKVYEYTPLEPMKNQSIHDELL